MQVAERVATHHEVVKEVASQPVEVESVKQAQQETKQVQQKQETQQFSRFLEASCDCV